MTREEAIKGLKVLRKDFSGYKPNEEMFDMAIEALEDRPKGEWVSRSGCYGVAYCSECNYELRVNNTNYCPNCGADMRGEDE